jgi:GntR family transcriptional regulator, arabinose operon transcriptional repressor
MKAKKTHQYVRVIHDLEKKIHAGRWKEGNYIPTEKEICKIYDVSQITTRRALYELQRMGYIKRQHGIGNQLISRTAGVTPASVCMVMRPEEHLHAPLAERIIAGLQNLKYRVFSQTIGTVQKNPEAAAYLQPNAKTLVMEGLSIDEGELVRNTMQGIEFSLFVVPDGLGSERFSACIESDVFHAGYVAARHCVGCGYKRLVFFTYPLDPNASYATSYRRHYEGMQAACLENKTEMLLRDVADKRNDKLPDSIKRMLAEAGKGCAILSNMDFLAAQVHRVARDLGWRIPKDLGLVGYLNTPWSISMDITTVNMAVDVIARHAIKVVHERKEGRITVPPTLVVRGSTRAISNRGDL